MEEIPDHYSILGVKRDASDATIRKAYHKLALENQSSLNKIQNINNTLFCGSYFGYGFHEDGITSSIDMLKSIND